MKEPFLLLKVHLKRFSIQKDRLDYPSRRGEKLFRQGLSQIGHLDGSFSGSSKRPLNPGPGDPWRDGVGVGATQTQLLCSGKIAYDPSYSVRSRSAQYVVRPLQMIPSGLHRKMLRSCFCDATANT